MQETEQLIAIYHTGFIICLCLAVVFAAASIFIFIKFKIRRVFNFLTGRTEKRTIRQMEEENAQTGKLRQDTYVPETTGDLYTTPSGSIPPVIYPATEEMATGTEPTEKMGHDVSYTRSTENSGAEETTLLGNSGSEETELLRENSADSEATELLHENMAGGSGKTGLQGETTLLTPEMEKEMRKAQEKKPYHGKFEIIKEMMLIHTEERI